MSGAAGKHAATARLRDAGARAAFAAACEAFVADVVCPAVAAAMPAPPAALRVQSFPCVRLIMPGEFSLAPHSDCDRGFAATTVNVVVPLTAYSAAAGAAALHVESSEGAEDWHPVVAGPGELLRFYGVRCLHWTAENTTTATRASLDLRVDVAPAPPAAAEQHGAAAAFARGYFCAYARSAGGVWARAEPLPPPDYRIGYPFGGVRPAHEAVAPPRSAPATATPPPSLQ